MKQYILSKEFEIIYKTNQERIERLKQFREAFLELSEYGNKSCRAKNRELSRLCTERINYYKEQDKCMERI